MQNIAGRLLRGSIWVAAARALVNLLQFASTIFLARLLTPADFGLVALGTTMLAIVNSVTDMSLSQALIHHKEPTDEHFHTAWTLGAIRGLVLGAFVAAIGLPMAGFYHDSRLPGIMLAFGIATFLGGLTNPRRVMLAKDLVFWQEFLLSVSQKLVTVVLAIGIAWYYQSYWALVIGAVVGQVFADIISYTFIPFRPRFGVRHARELWSFSIWLTLGQAMSTINWRFDQLLVGSLLGRSALGFYSVGDNLAQTPTREATAPLTKTLYPAFSRISDDPVRLRRAYFRSQTLVTAIALPAGIGVALIARPLVELTMGAKWLPAVAIIQALSVVFALQTLGSLVAPLAMSLGHSKLLFRRDAQMFVVRLPIIIVATYAFGLPGLIYARCLTGMIAMVVNMTLIRNLIGTRLREQVGSSWRALGAAAAMALVVIVLQAMLPASSAHEGQLLAITVSIAAGALAYVGASTVMWWISGTPDGPEMEFQSLLSKILKRRSSVSTESTVST